MKEGRNIFMILVRKYPNDLELGEKCRQHVHPLLSKHYPNDLDLGTEIRTRTSYLENGL